MRIALLTALARPADGARKLAFRCFLGRNVLSHQVDCALELGCEAIFCLVDGVGQEIIEAQHRAERAKVRFQTVADTRALSALVRAEDEIFVLSDGLLPDPDILMTEIAERRGILVFPAEEAVPRGFERIDPDWAWAGAMRIRGARIEELGQLPPDADPASALIRIAMRAGVRPVPIESARIDRGDWIIAYDNDLMITRERNWIHRYVTPVSFSAPGSAVAERIGIRLARDTVGGKSELIPTWVVVVSAVLAALAALGGRPMLGLVFAIPMVVALPIASVIERVSRIGGRFRGKLPVQATLRWAADLLLVGLVALTTVSGTGPDWIPLYMALVLFAAIRIGERTGFAFLRPVLSDRIVLMAVIIPAAYFGILETTIALVGLAILASVILAIRPD